MPVLPSGGRVDLVVFSFEDGELVEVVVRGGEEVVPFLVLDLFLLGS